VSRHVICVHGGQRFAIPLAAVRRVTEVSPLSRVPRAPPGLLGVMNHAGRVACVTDVQGIEQLADDAVPLPERQGAAVAQLDRPEGPVKLIDPELLSRAIDHLVEA